MDIRRTSLQGTYVHHEYTPVNCQAEVNGHSLHISNRAACSGGSPGELSYFIMIIFRIIVNGALPPFSFESVRATIRR